MNGQKKFQLTWKEILIYKNQFSLPHNQWKKKKAQFLLSPDSYEISCSNCNPHPRRASFCGSITTNKYATFYIVSFPSILK